MDQYLPRLEPGESRRGLIQGPAGALEYRLDMSDSEPQAVAVICHPHPLFSGTMDNKVVYSLARSAQSCGVAALRFQFRGVGSSDGPHDKGVGEALDTAFMLGELRRIWPQVPAFLMGFSFGAYMALKVAAENDDVAGLIAIAPPLMYAGDAAVPQPHCPWLVIHGDADDVVAHDDTLERARAMAQPPEFHTIAGVGHFFHGELTQLRSRVETWLTARLAESGD